MATELRRLAKTTEIEDTRRHSEGVMIRRTFGPILALGGMCLCLGAVAGPKVGVSDADGDLTLLTSYQVPAEKRSAFETEVRASAVRSIEQRGNIWLMYEEPAKDAHLMSSRYFTVHFPVSIDELTEPSSAIFEIVSTLGSFRVHAELTRQVPSWCSTVNLDASKLQYAYVEYLWLKPNALTNVGRLMDKRGEILRSVYGTTSDGNSAVEGFVAMVAPFQVMHVLFSSASSREQATRIFRHDIEAHGLLDDWDMFDNALENLLSKRQIRSGKFRPKLSVDYP